MHPAVSLSRAHRFPRRFKRLAPASAKFFLTALAISSLVACGGSGGDDDGDTGGNPGGPNPGSGTSSSACFNEADFREGTVSEVEQDTLAPNSEVFKARVTTTTGPRESFAGANPVRFVRETYIYATGTGGSERQYVDLVNGKEIRYGSRNGDENADPMYGRKINHPPIERPVDMQPGEKTESTTVVETIQGANDEIRNEETVTSTITYIGREALSTPMGIINACKFAGTSHVVYPGGASIDQTSEQWVAAEGPYRGQELKLAVQDSQQAGIVQFVATKITYTPK
ncbi:MAG: hypothetical protein WBC18_19885 [Ottowia sp.]|uniref:hypothetical protein n=1 Tax=Ottowia sp. TaxID=1898956 RepID=UPI003C72AA7A